MTKKIISIVAVLLANLLLPGNVDACNGWEPQRDEAGRLPMAKVMGVWNERDEGVWLDNYQGSFWIADSVSFDAAGLREMSNTAAGRYTEFVYEFRRGGNTEDYLDDPERYDHWDGIWGKYNNTCILGIGYIFGSVCLASWNYGETHTAFYTDLPWGDVKGSEEADLWFDHTRGRAAGARELANILRGYDILSLGYDGCSITEECDEEYEMSSDVDSLVPDTKYHIGIFFKVDSNDGTSETPWTTSLHLEEPPSFIVYYTSADSCSLASGSWSIEPDAPLLNSLDSDPDGISNNLDPDDDNDGVLDATDAFPYNAAESTDTDGDRIGNNADPDDDNDGYTDSEESSCGTNPLNASSRPADDNDSDMVPDCIDTDDDNDGVTDTSDAFPFNRAEWVDTDGDRIGNNADMDDDGDGYLDFMELSLGTDPLDARSRPADNDGDLLPDSMDVDDDNDGVNDIYDIFPLDASEFADTDGDGVGDNTDTDDDDDGFSDTEEVAEGTDSRNPFSIPTDSDGDGLSDSIDEDDDNDGVLDISDALPFDSTESADNDSDGLGDNRDLDDDNDLYVDAIEVSLGTNPSDPSSKPADHDEDLLPNAIDPDDDNDGVPDISDAFPFDPVEAVDTDGDGIGDNADTDDDNDGYSDAIEISEGTNHLDPASKPADNDGDFIPDSTDTDDDNDGVLDVSDAFPLNPAESIDTDRDGTGNNADTDDDNDRYRDEVERREGTDPLNPSSTPADFDHDLDPDSTDPDDDNDGVPDSSDAFPFNAGEWVDTDGDGIGNNADADDDGDGYSDLIEGSEGTDPLNRSSTPADFDGDFIPNSTDPDDDNDGVADTSDAFPFNRAEWADTDRDGIGNNADTDDDNDGMPDTWEITYGLNPLVNDANSDKDGDRFTNEEEYHEGTDPSNAQNYPAFCGSSTMTACGSPSDCNIGGCGKPVCKHVDESIVSVCDARTCYDTTIYGISCGCYDAKCQWAMAEEVDYQVHVQDMGWLPWCEDGELCGTTGESRRIEAIKIIVPDNQVFYQVHVEGEGWLPWCFDGEVCGTTGESRRMEAIKIHVQEKRVAYQVHLEGSGWLPWCFDGEVCGTTGESRRMEAIKIIAWDESP